MNFIRLLVVQFLVFAALSSVTIATAFETQVQKSNAGVSDAYSGLYYSELSNVRYNFPVYIGKLMQRFSTLKYYNLSYQHAFDLRAESFYNRMNQPEQILSVENRITFKESSEQICFKFDPFVYATEIRPDYHCIINDVKNAGKSDGM